MGSTEVSTQRSENSWFRKSPSFPHRSNLKESFLSSETISPNSQSCASSRGWQQESKSSSHKRKLIGWVFLPLTAPGKTFFFFFSCISTFLHYYYTYSIHTQIWNYFVSDPDSGLSIKSFHIPYCFIFYQEDYKLIWNDRNLFYFQFLIVLYAAEKQYIMRSESSTLAWCPAGSR